LRAWCSRMADLNPLVRRKTHCRCIHAVIVPAPESRVTVPVACVAPGGEPTMSDVKLASRMVVESQAVRRDMSTKRAQRRIKF
jgi:hypothetical protein